MITTMITMGVITSRDAFFGPKFLGSHILQDLIHKIEGQPHQKEVDRWVLGVHVHIYLAKSPISHCLPVL